MLILNFNGYVNDSRKLFTKYDSLGTTLESVSLLFQIEKYDSVILIQTVGSKLIDYIGFI